MAASTPATPMQKRVIGGLAAALGLVVMLFGLGVLPAAGDPRGPPQWIVTGVGAAFFLIGAGVLAQAIVRPDGDGARSAGAPSWLGVFQYLAVTAVFGGFAAIMGWVAFGPGERPFSNSIVVFGIGVTEILGRASFGFGAVLMGICTLLLLAGGIGVLWQRNKDGQRGGMD
jgi:hypothetical protein